MPSRRKSEFDTLHRRLKPLHLTTTKKIAVVIIDHEGKGTTGGPRGTSAKTDITLERPESASPADGAHFIVRFTKKRGFHGESASPFIANLCDGMWEISEVPESGGSGSKSESSQKKRKSEAFRIFNEGGDVKQVITELKISQASAYRYEKEWKTENFGDF